MGIRLAVLSSLGFGVAVAAAAQPADPYLRYLQSAPEFQPVRQDRDFLLGRWRTWVYMPWRYQWAAGTGEAGGALCRELGINGGFLDGASGPGGRMPAELAWHDRFDLLFYVDHVAGKGTLHLKHQDGDFGARFKAEQRRVGERFVPLDAAAIAACKGLVEANIAAVRASPRRIAYALDDEISWGSFVRPVVWWLNGARDGYARWLQGVYGGAPPHSAELVAPDAVRGFYGKPFREWDLSPLCDGLAYNDSVWANVLGDLVDHANRADPETPCGFVGGQAPSPFGGFDYQKLVRKVQFIESYDLGSSQAILRSFNPGNALPQVTTHFHKTIEDSRWQSWYYLAHGNRGMIGWVEGWFDGTSPKPWLKAFAPTLKEIAGRVAPKQVGATWVHDGVALYYSHPSIQVGWVLDIEPHKATWTNRNGDHRLGTAPLVRQAWEQMLRDEGIQYSFVGYRDVAVGGVPKGFRVLILPAAWALSDAEARRIREFAESGGTVIADFGTGLFDPHGRGRAKGALDDLFGLARDGTIGARGTLFGGALCVETDQDAGFSYKRIDQLFATVPCPEENGFAVAERGLKTLQSRAAGRGRAVFLNLSPQRYLMHRADWAGAAARRKAFLKPILEAGARPWVTVHGADGARPPNAEITYWSKDGRTLLFLVQNVPMGGGELGGGSGEGLVPGREEVTIRFAAPVQDLVDERTGDRLGTVRETKRSWDRTEAVVLSFQGDPPAAR